MDHQGVAPLAESTGLGVIENGCLHHFRRDPPLGNGADEGFKVVTHAMYFIIQSTLRQARACSLVLADLPVYSHWIWLRFPLSRWLRSVARRGCLGSEAGGLLPDFLNLRGEFLGREWFRQKGDLGPDARALKGQSVRVARHEDDGEVLPRFLKLFNEFGPAHVRHDYIGDD